MNLNEGHKINQKLFEQAYEDSLPGQKLSKIWEVLGLILIIPTIVISIIIIGKLIVIQSEKEEKIWQYYWMLLTICWAAVTILIPFTIAAIIQIMNARTLELRRLREDIIQNKK